MPSTKVLVAIAQVLKDEGYIGEFEVIEKTPQNELRITLRYGADKNHSIREIKRVSKPGLRVYAGKDAIPRVKSGLGYRDCKHAARCADRLRSPASGYRRRGALHRLLDESGARTQQRKQNMSRIGRRPITVPERRRLQDDRGQRSHGQGSERHAEPAFSPDLTITIDNGIDHHRATE